MVIANSFAPSDANVSAVKVHLTTFFNFFDCHANGNINFPFLLSKSTNSSSCESSHFKFVKEASLKQTNDTILKSFICGNDKKLHYFSAV